jgi:hypothetical protein
MPATALLAARLGACRRRLSLLLLLLFCRQHLRWRCGVQLALLLLMLLLPHQQHPTKVARSRQQHGTSQLHVQVVTQQVAA